MTPHLPAERRAALDHALARVVSDLAPDTPLWAQLDYFKEHVQEPTLPEWCLWFAETENVIDADFIRHLWSGWLESAGDTRRAREIWNYTLGITRGRVAENLFTLRRLQRRVLALFPEVVVGEREWRFPIPEYARDNPAFDFWAGQMRDSTGVRPGSWIHPQPRYFDCTPEGDVYLCYERVTADRLILPEKGQ